MKHHSDGGRGAREQRTFGFARQCGKQVRGEEKEEREARKLVFFQLQEASGNLLAAGMGSAFPKSESLELNPPLPP
jgi:hypothetical protein